jgi:PIN domain nuclease of toxin-antitoxin system
MRVLLDTETFSIATMDGLPALPKKVRSLLTEDETDLWISATTILEIAKKHGTGKMLFNEELVRKGAVDLRLTIIPYEPRHAY